MASQKRRSVPVSVLRWIGRGLLALVLLFVASLVLGRFLPVPSNLMLARWVTGQPVDRVWVPLDAIAPNLIDALIASEDQRYCLHHGVDFVALQEVLDDEGGPSRGASTLTMQVAKNIYLWPGRSYLRKALEIPLALILDLVWGKRRVLEIYLNVAEWGDGLFGVEAAARRYDHLPAKALSAQQSARLVAALPNPFRRQADKSSAASRRVLRRSAVIGDLTGCVR